MAICHFGSILKVMKKVTKKSTKDKRPSWDNYFLQLAEMIGSRSTCDRGYAGALAVKDKRIIATGYSGSPVGLKHCSEIGHEMHTVVNDDGTTSRHCIRTSHSETNAINNAARVGAALQGATMYSNYLPCYNCAKNIINAGIIRMVTLYDYHASKQTKRVFKEAGVKLTIINKEVKQYKDQ